MWGILRLVALATLLICAIAPAQADYNPVPSNSSRVLETTTATAIYCDGYPGGTQACLNAAAALAGTNNSGSGNSVDVYLPNGVQSVCNFTLVSGLKIHGTNTRTTYVAGQPPDYQAALNGGTVLDGCGGVVFTGSQLRGADLHGLAFQNFGTVAISIGGPNVDGIAFSYWDHLYFVGNPTCCSSGTAMLLYNAQHLTTDTIYVWYVNTGLDMRQQASWTSDGNNELKGQTYILTYAKSVANGNNTTFAVNLQTLAPSSGSIQTLNNVKIRGLQVNEASGGDGTGTMVNVAGAPKIGSTLYQNNDIEILGADLEGNDAIGISITNTRYSKFGLGQHAQNTYDISLGTGAANNVIDCTVACFIAPLPTGEYNDNIFYGLINALPLIYSGGISGAFMTQVDDTFHLRGEQWSNQIGGASIPMSSLLSSASSSVSSGSAASIVNFISTASYSQWILQGASNYNNYSTIGPGSYWTMGTSGSTGWQLSDVTTGRNLLYGEVGAPTNSIRIGVNGVGIGTASPVGGGGVLTVVPATTVTLSGTAGMAKMTMPEQGTFKMATAYLSGYAETGGAQTYTFPTAFSANPILVTSGCGPYAPSATPTALTLPANAAMTATTCQIVAMGQ